MANRWSCRESSGRTAPWRPSTKSSSPSTSAGARSAAGSPTSASDRTSSVNKFIAVFFLVLAGCATAPAGGLERIETIVVIYAENRSFDHLYGLFPGANGIANATPEQYVQVDRDGKPLPYLPPVWKGNERDPAYPAQLPNKPFRLELPPVNMPLTVRTR